MFLGNEIHHPLNRKNNCSTTLPHPSAQSQRDIFKVIFVNNILTTGNLYKITNRDYEEL